MAQDLEIGTIVRRNTIGKKRYIVVDVGPQHEPTEEERKYGWMHADRCDKCEVFQVTQKGKRHTVQTLCNQLICDGNRRKDGKHVCWKIYSTGRLSREKIVYKEQ